MIRSRNPIRGRHLLVLALAATTAACGVRQELGFTDKSAPAAGAGDLMSAADREQLAALTVARASGGPGAGYRIGPDDLLDVRIPDLVDAAPPAGQRATANGAALPTVAEAPVGQTGVRVSAAGDITVAQLGTVRAAGLTPAELQDDLAARLVAAGLLRRPQVSVQVTEYRSRVVAVIGSVERPGLYPLTRPGATIADMVWAAGGPNKEAGRLVEFVPARDGEAPPDPTTVALASGAPGRIRIDLGFLQKAAGQGATSLNPPVRPGDVITLPPAGSVLVDGWVDKPGSYPVTRGLTLTGAVAAAGGHLFPADRQHVTVKRVVAPDEQHFFTIDLDAVSEGRVPDFPLTDGDVVRLPASPGRLLPWGIWNVAKEMVHVGGSVLLF